MLLTDKEILQKAIVKAEYKGFINLNVLGTNSIQGILHKDYYSVIFSHSFAKAFWGESLVDASIGYEEYLIPAYIYHLQQMVLEKNPLDYLSKFLTQDSIKGHCTDTVT